MNYKFSYLVNLQFLGFRLHGWQKQPKVKTVHFLVDKTLKFILKGVVFKSIGVGRTDGKVSSTYFIFQLFINSELKEDDFIWVFNLNSPSDLKVISVKRKLNKKFNLIQHPKIKEYCYYFSFGEKNHPYSAPFLTGIIHNLDIEIMKEGAKLFEGVHNFKYYCTKPSKTTKVVREILTCKIVENTYLTASFFPKKSYVLVVRAEGFLRNQIRLIMGVLFELGKGNYSLNFIIETLKSNCKLEFLKSIAPASGLHLQNIKLLDN